MLTHNIDFKIYVPILRDDNDCDSSYIPCEMFVAKCMVLINVIILRAKCILEFRQLTLTLTLNPPILRVNYSWHIVCH